MVFLGVFALQIAIPAAKLRSGSQSRFGWQMFARLGSDPWFGVRYADGSVDTVQVGDYLARVRSDIDLPALLPPHLCRQFDEAVTVLVRWRGVEGRATDYPCP